MTDLTIYIPAYNAMPFLPETVESAFAQTFSDLVLLIINDGSTDGTADYLDCLNDERVRVVHQENRGVVATARRALELCETEFLARLDADDVALPNRIEYQRDFLLAHPDVSLLGAQVIPLGEKATGQSLCLPTKHEDIYKAAFEGRHAMAYSTVMMRTSMVRQVGGIWEHSLFDEFDLMLRVGEYSKLANSSEVLQQYRIHEGSINGSSLARLQFSSDYARELARRRTLGLSAISPDEFSFAQNSRPWWQRKAESLDHYARRQYRLAQGEIYGSKRWQGRARMAWAALCSPQLTSERVVRSVRHRFGKLHSTPL